MKRKLVVHIQNLQEIVSSPDVNGIASVFMGNTNLSGLHMHYIVIYYLKNLFLNVFRKKYIH